MKTVTLSFEEAVALAARQNYEYDLWNDDEDMDSWDEMKQVYINEAIALFKHGGESYKPEEAYNKAHPDNEHVFIVLKSE
jgi:hypothetical protein